MLNKKNFYINGEWIKPNSSEEITVVDPATEENCDVITLGDKIDVDKAVKAAKNEMKMIAEGFHASSCVNELNKKYKVSAPIADAVFQIVHNGKSPEKTISALSSVMH